MQASKKLNTLISKYLKNIVLVHFTTPGSGKGYIMGQMLIDIVHQFSKEVEFLEIDLTKDRGLSQEIGLKEVPTLFFYVRGNLEAKLSGICPKEKINQTIQQLIDKLN